MTTSDFATLDLTTLSSIHGGQAAPPAQPSGSAQPRTWGQVAREYGAACATGAGKSLAAGGAPRSLKDAAISAATGCAMGVATKAIDDVGGMLSGPR